MTGLWTDRERRTKDGQGREFGRILKMPKAMVAAATAMLARSRGIHFGRAEAARRRRRRRRRFASPLQKHAINYPGIAASTIPSVLHK